MQKSRMQAAQLVSCVLRKFGYSSSTPSPELPAAVSGIAKLFLKNFPALMAEFIPPPLMAKYFSRYCLRNLFSEMNRQEYIYSINPFLLIVRLDPKRRWNFRLGVVDGFINT
jgi:hypothetical protein